jgi:hypothetical protein
VELSLTGTPETSTPVEPVTPAPVTISPDSQANYRLSCIPAWMMNV